MARPEPVFATSHGKPRVDDRSVLSGIIFINRNVLRWCDAPMEYGPHKTLHNRWKRWSENGVFARILVGLAASATSPSLRPNDLKSHRTATSLWVGKGGVAGRSAPCFDVPRLPCHPPEANRASRSGEAAGSAPARHPADRTATSPTWLEHQSDRSRIPSTDPGPVLGEQAHPLNPGRTPHRAGTEPDLRAAHGQRRPPVPPAPRPS